MTITCMYHSGQVCSKWKQGRFVSRISCTVLASFRNVIETSSVRQLLPIGWWQKYYNRIILIQHCFREQLNVTSDWPLCVLETYLWGKGDLYSKFEYSLIFEFFWKIFFWLKRRRAKTWSDCLSSPPFHSKNKQKRNKEINTTCFLCLFLRIIQ